MKKTFSRTRRIGVAEAKSELSRVLREVSSGPVVIHSRGRDLAVLVGIDEYEREHASPPTSVTLDLLARIDQLKRELGGGADLKTEPVDYEPLNPFRRARSQDPR